MPARELGVASEDAPRVVRALQSLFWGRRDDFIKTTYRADGSTTRRWRTKQPLTDGVVGHHIRGLYSVGPYILSPDILEGRGCRFGCVDIDRSDPAAADGARDVCAALKALGITPRVELSKSMRWHIWTFFSGPVESADLRKVLGHVADQVLERHSLYQLDRDDFTKFKIAKNGTKISAVEVFPKHDALKGRVTVSSGVQLPLNGAHLRRGGTAMVDPGTWKPYADQAAALLAIKPDAPEIVVKAAAATPDPPKPPPKKRKRRKPKRARGDADPWADIRARIDLGEYIESVTDQRARRAGKGLLFKCPFHDDEIPSLSVEPDDGLWKCHAAGCGLSGDLFHFHMKFYDVGKREALEQLAELAGVELKSQADERENRRPQDGHPVNAPSVAQEKEDKDVRAKQSVRGGQNHPPEEKHGEPAEGVPANQTRRSVQDIQRGTSREDSSGGRAQGSDEDSARTVGADGCAGGRERNGNGQDDPGGPPLGPDSNREEHRGSRTAGVRGVKAGGHPPPPDPHPNAPRFHAKQIILEWMDSEVGPRFKWRRGGKAYSERDETEYTVREWKEKYDENIFKILIERAKQTKSKAGSPDLQVQEDAAAKAFRMWAGPAFMEKFKALPQKGEGGEVTASEEAEIIAAMTAALSKTFRIWEGMAEMYIMRSVLRLAIERRPPAWHQIPNLGVWIKAGPRIALSYDFIMDHGDASLKRFGRKAFARALRKFGIAESDNFTSGQRGYVINDAWLSETFDLDLDVAADEPEPAAADVKRASAADKENDDVPF